MTGSKKVFINTIVQYLRSIINILVTLYVTRVVLLNLGVEDYGIYSLIGGLLSMLSFVQLSLSSTTLRFLSYYQGENDLKRMKEVFNNSILTQLLFSFIVILILLILKGYLFESFLNIPLNKIEVSKQVFNIMIISLLPTMLSTPLIATIVSHEDIVYSTLVSLLDSILKIPIAIFIAHVTCDRLLFYSSMLLILQFINISLYILFCRKYKEVCFPNIFTFSFSLFKKMFGFVTWIIYDTGCVIGRMQGISLILNRTFGTVANASYGIAWNITGQLSFLSSSIQNAIKPRIIRSEGEGNRQYMLYLSELTCKVSFLLLALIAIPSIFEMETLLYIWLKEVPKYSVFFCQMALLSNLIDQLTIGFFFANQAIGKLKYYSLSVSTIKLLCIPLVLICLHYNKDIHYVMIAFVFVEFLSAIARIPFLHKTGGLKYSSFFKDVITRILLPTIASVIICFIVKNTIHCNFRFIFTFFFSSIGMIFIACYCALTLDEKNNIKKIFKTYSRKNKK